MNIDEIINKNKSLEEELQQTNEVQRTNLGKRNADFI
jgi:hypothetical protein